jgi:hypothetical protein
VSNIGNVTVTDIALNDVPLGPVSCPSNSLTANTSMTCTATHVTTQADVANVCIVNVATVTGKDGTSTLSATATARVRLTPDKTKGDDPQLPRTARRSVGLQRARSRRLMRRFDRQPAPVGSLKDASR